MIKKALIMLCFGTLVYSNTLTLPWTKNIEQNTQSIETAWEKNVTFLKFLELNRIPMELYWNQSVTDQELCAEITAGIKYQTLKNDKDEILQVLIPISDEMQIHLNKDINGHFVFDIIPIVYELINETIAVTVTSIPSINIVEHTGNSSLANSLIRTFNNTVNFRGMKKGDHIAITYKHKVRMGKYFGYAHITSAMVEVNGQKNYMIRNTEDDKFYNEKGHSLTNYFFKVPLRYKRISSRFTNKRWHPVLKRYRAHLGVDYAAPRGRVIKASADGKIVSRGRKGGYGKTIEIKHKYGYKTLYAHMNKYKGGLRRGSYVKQGTIIGYVGSTGLSSGPHLHFGLYKNGRAINPLKVVKVATTRLKGKAFKAFKELSKRNKNTLNDAIGNPSVPSRLEPFEDLMSSTIKS
ncbi:MAG: peptidoglycan DD-metalloendopeptidase family protein [Campylobacterota bacterium]|nr:peptidoglycan DD-metalloendopeptidase family protein [Campylobacterota bacterium]